MLEGFTLLFDQVDTSLARFIHYSLNFIVFLLTPLIGSLWAIYLDHKIFKSRDHIRKNFYYLHPFLLGVVLLIINFFVPVLFSISADNVYSREPFIMVNAAVLYILLIYVAYFALKNKNNIDKKIFYGSLLFLGFPALGGCNQIRGW